MRASEPITMIRQPMTERVRRFTASLALASGGLLLLLWFTNRQGGPLITYDAYQYIDAAATLTSSSCLCTNFGHFEEQISKGTFPVPFTHFPPGYPLVIAAGMSLGGEPSTVGFFFSALGYLIAIVLTRMLALELGAAELFATGAALLVLSNSKLLGYSAMLVTESMFIACMIFVAWAIVRDMKSFSNARLALSVGAITGLAFEFRYAGLFLMPVTFFYLCYRIRQSRSVWPSIGGAVAMIGMSGATMARNVIHTGDWKGGFSAGETLPLVAALKESVKAGGHIVLGDRVPFRVDFWLIVLAAASLLVAWRALAAIRGAASRGALSFPTTVLGLLAKPLFWVLGMAATSAAGILVVSLTTIASDLGRYYLTVYPLILAVIAYVLSRLDWTPSWTRAAAAVMIGGSLIVIHSRSMLAAPYSSPHTLLDRALAGNVAPGLSARDWLISNTRPDDVIVSVWGQPMHFVTKRRVVSLIEPNLTSRDLQEPGVRNLMTKFRARFLVLFPHVDGSILPEQSSNNFLRGMANGERPLPGWLRVAASAPGVMVLECGMCAP